jgi:hypothetical protein
MVIPVGAAERLGDNFVHNAEPEQIASGEAKSMGRLGSELVALPQDPGTPLGADHGIISVLQDSDPVPYPDS